VLPGLVLTYRLACPMLSAGVAWRVFPLVGESPTDILLGGAGVTGWGLALFFLWAFITDRVVSSKSATQWRDLYLAEAKQKEELLTTVKAMEQPLLALAEGVKQINLALVGGVEIAKRAEAEIGSLRTALKEASDIERATLDSVKHDLAELTKVVRSRRPTP